MAFPYPVAGLATVLAILVFIWTGFVLGAARKKHGIWPPLTQGPEEFNRVWRAHQNTFEALPQVIPALWLFAVAVSDLWAGILTLVWALGRILYVRGYARAAERRTPGFVISSLAMLAMLLGGGGAIVAQLIG